MPSYRVSEARSHLYQLVDEASATHEPILIEGKRGNAILVSEEDWRAIEETLYLLSVKGMRGAIRKGLKTPVAQCDETLKW